ncbi:MULTISPECIES: hypothetical protein [Streptomyces]|uniref:Uncharacterized protein n=1 Tax=Streptomyces griseus TaxID=1911 RepID=A0A380P968_STRGR|nr:hypothetical protein [Streptomyces griseus]NEE50778.1 hypothetical protein [Streptomyces sp. SID8455]SUP61750.1 Uncharacterised protein [Streptomyces griseus]
MKPMTATDVLPASLPPDGLQSCAGDAQSTRVRAGARSLLRALFGVDGSDCPGEELSRQLATEIPRAELRPMDREASTVELTVPAGDDARLAQLAYSHLDEPRRALLCLQVALRTVGLAVPTEARPSERIRIGALDTQALLSLLPPRHQLACAVQVATSHGWSQESCIAAADYLADGDQGVVSALAAAVDQLLAEAGVKAVTDATPAGACATATYETVLPSDGALALAGSLELREVHRDAL